MERSLALPKPTSEGTPGSSQPSGSWLTDRTAAAYGAVRKPVYRQDSVREGSLIDMEIVNDVDTAVRGSGRGSDVEFQLSLGYQLLIDEEGGYAIIRRGRVAKRGRA